MHRLRSRLFVLTVAVVACQLAGLAAVPVVICVNAAAPHGDDSAITCTCAHGASGECPMHKPKPKAFEVAQRIPHETPRWCTGCDDGLQAVLTAFTAVLRDRQTTAVSQSVVTVVVPRAGVPLARARPPMVPPPRCESTDVFEVVRTS